MKLPLLLLTTLLAGCGAFADAADPDGGTPDAGPTLKVRPQFIQPGQLDEYGFTFMEGPPWKKTDCNYTYVSDLNTGGTDIEYRTVTYDGEKLITVTLKALREVKIGERAVSAEATCNRQGKPQLIYSEWGRLYVHELDQGDGGTR